jgi:hypothetical protein
MRARVGLEILTMFSYMFHFTLTTLTSKRKMNDTDWFRGQGEKVLP